MAPVYESFSLLETFSRNKAYFDPRLFEVHSTVDNGLLVQPKSSTPPQLVLSLEAVPIIPAKDPDNSLPGLHFQIRGDTSPVPFSTTQEQTRSISYDSTTRVPQQKDFSPFGNFADTSFDSYIENGICSPVQSVLESSDNGSEPDIITVEENDVRKLIAEELKKKMISAKNLYSRVRSSMHC
ncbi:Uracil permease [Penicillium atrosanguineum]|uniref:Uracil permease n=1 Tax=Penicillium atrosanguineum TaxID=1132637 RepID=UPI002393BFEB|nr:Uracil permease [Penicillium atrosanguineum]KAJ5314348.1 Uracil permease [Penicillium atrosanguineum]